MTHSVLLIQSTDGRFVFFTQRTRFIQHLYESGGQPFRETIRKIEAEEEPYIQPYSEDPEPAFLTEWIEADEALEVLGRTCLSMLSPSLQLYFRTWERELGVQWEEDERKRAFKKGMIGGDRYYFEKILGVSWDDCSAELSLVEQITLARNLDQHPENITTMRVRYGNKDLERYSHPFFMSETEQNMFAEEKTAQIGWLSASVHVSREKLIRAIEETVTLATWLEEHLQTFRWSR